LSRKPQAAVAPPEVNVPPRIHVPKIPALDFVVGLYPGANHRMHVPMPRRRPVLGVDMSPRLALLVQCDADPEREG